MNKILNNYLILNFLKVKINVILIFVCLSIVLNLFEEIEFFKDLNVGIGLPIILNFLFIPNLLIKLLPFIIFISAMWYLISLNSSKDLLTLKVFGFSNLKIVFILSITSFVFGLFVILAINPVTSVMIKYYEQTKAEYSKDIEHLVSINKNGVWIKEIKNKNLRIITAKKLDGNFLNNVSIYDIDSENNIKKRYYSNKADISNNLWKFKEIQVFNFQDEFSLKNIENFELLSSYDSEKLSSLYRNLDTISFINLLSKFDEFNEKGYSKKLLSEKLNSFLSLPIFLFLMVILASIFTMKISSKPQNIYYIFISIISCVVIYYFKDLSIALGQTNKISLTLAVWMPIIALTLFCSIGILHINEK